ncbi:dehydratase [Chromatiales bacterium (ex Bugula neritina AB1)]|nr:dehydratase [Chromatiales bacterium (ex Bugula neritina AB1)]
MTPIKAVETLRLDEFPNLVWVVIEDADGVRGLGETFMGAEAVETYIHDTVAEKILGRDSRSIESVRMALRPYVGHQAAGIEQRGNSAIDIALWDLWGRSTGQPVWQLLGGKVRESIRTYNTCAGYQYVRAATGQHTENWGLGNEQSQGPYEDLQAFLTDAGTLAESLLDNHITGMKIWPFDSYAEKSHGAAITPAELREGCEPFRKIREKVGEHMQIMLECHSLWSAPAARDIVQALAPYNIYWIEDPISINNLAALADLRQRIDVKVTASETLASRQQFAALIQAQAVDIVMLDLAWCGGLTEAKAIASLAEASNLPIAPHDCTGPVVWAASCHLSVNAPNTLIQESVRAFYTGWYTELVDRLPQLDNGQLTPPAGDGLGMNLKPELFTRADATHRRSQAE